MVRSVTAGVLGVILYTSSALSSELPVSETSGEEFAGSDPVISKLMPERAHGKGFKMVYWADTPPDVFWRFKTNFDNQLVLSNKYINSHRLVSREGNRVVTETVYSYKPKAVFRWQTTVFPDQYLLKYELLNPQECGQEYHYGHIQLEAAGTGTRVTQVDYFDFFGVSLWVNYPFKGGMSQFLEYTARWEQQFIAEFGHQYQQ